MIGIGKRYQRCNIFQLFGLLYTPTPTPTLALSLFQILSVIALTEHAFVSLRPYHILLDMRFINISIIITMEQDFHAIFIAKGIHVVVHGIVRPEVVFIFFIVHSVSVLEVIEF